MSQARLSEILAPGWRYKSSSLTTVTSLGTTNALLVQPGIVFVGWSGLSGNMAIGFSPGTGTSGFTRVASYATPAQWGKKVELGCCGYLGVSLATYTSGTFTYEIAQGAK